MRAVVQRVDEGRVLVGERLVGEIATGLLVLVGVEAGDGPADAAYIAGKVRDLRIFEDEGDAEGRTRMNRSVVDVGGAVLVVSQFTLCGDARIGRRPSFAGAAAPEIARVLYEEVVRRLGADGLRVATGEFQADMRVQSINNGPVTILLDSRKTF